MRIVKILLFTIAVLTSNSIAQAAPVDINTASAELMAVNIKGIGKKKAEAIVTYRRANGPFKRVEELTKVKGIGPKIIKKNRQNLLVSVN